MRYADVRLYDLDEYTSDIYVRMILKDVKEHIRNIDKVNKYDKLHCVRIRSKLLVGRFICTYMDWHLTDQLFERLADKFLEVTWTD